MKNLFTCVFFLCALLAWAPDAPASTFISRATGNASSTGTWAILRTGTITTSTASTTVSGAGTLFTTELAAGDQLFTAGGVLIGTVSTITNATTLRLTANAASNNGAIPYYGTTSTVPGLAVGDIVAINSPNTVFQDAPGSIASLTINGGGTLTQANSLTMTGALIVAGTLTSSTTLTVGSVTNITGSLNITSNGSTHTFTGAVTITAGTWSNSGNESITFRNGLALNGGTFTAGTGVYTFDTNSQAIGGTSSISIPSVTVTGVTLTNNGTLTVGSVLAGSGGIINAANATLNITGTSAITTLTAAANGNTVLYNGAAQTVKLPSGAPATYYNLTISGSGIKTMPATVMTISNDFITSGTASVTAAQALTVGRNFTVGASTTFSAATFSHSVAGDFSNSGTFAGGTSTVTFTGGVAQALGGAAATTFNNLTINKSANKVSIACATPSPTVNATLTLTSGDIITSGTSPGCSTACGSQVPVIVAAAGTIAGGSNSSYINGALRKFFSAGAVLNFRAAGQDEFPLGDASNYTPVEITAGGTSTAGYVTVCVTPTEHPQVTTPPVATGGIDAAKSVNRYWSLTASGINTASGAGSALVDATFKFVASDVDAGANTSNFVIEEWDGAKWNPTTLTTAAGTSTRVQNIDLSTATNDIAIGEPLSGFNAGAGNFNAFDSSTPAGAVLGMIQTKQSGVAFSVRLVRLTAAKNSLDSTYNQAGVTVELLDSSDNTGALSSSTACRPVGGGAGQWHVIASTTQTVTFAAGLVATVNFTVPNSYRDVRVHVLKVGTGVGEGCSTDRFAIRPQSLTITALDGDWNTAGTSRALGNVAASGGTVHKASTAAATTPRPFTLRASPVPASATNYDGSPSAVTGFPSCTGLGALCTTAGSLSFTAGSWTSSGGFRENATANYSEVGSFNLQLEDTSYASVDAVDGTPAGTRTVPATATAQLGRFVPNHFIVAPTNTPQFRTFGAACASRSFTYVGQAFGYVTAPQALVTAQNAGSATTTNYTGSLWKISTSAPSDVTQTYGNGGIGPALDTALATNAPTIASLGNGTGTVTVSLSDKLSYTRSATTPLAQFNAVLSLTMTVRDDSEADGQILTATSTPFNAIAFDSGTLFRYGRLRMQNSSGSQLIGMPVPIETQYWNGTAFVTNTADNCTTISAANVVLGNYQRNLTAGETSVTVGGAFSAGIGTLRLSAPGTNNNGSADVSVNLTGTAAGASCTAGMPSSTASGLDYLQSAWCGTSYNRDPTARATFGVYRNSDRLLYQRENF
ncbi:MAG: hypothetical protein JWN13_2393 [Betaproteobacteria bacterium]|nr:hypothetical protein [Betaproteobacteria bacterium]